jgi:hypothetical protein
MRMQQMISHMVHKNVNRKREKNRRDEKSDLGTEGKLTWENLSLNLILSMFLLNVHSILSALWRKHDKEGLVFALQEDMNICGNMEWALHLHVINAIITYLIKWHLKRKILARDWKGLQKRDSIELDGK